MVEGEKVDDDKAQRAGDEDKSVLVTSALVGVLLWSNDKSRHTVGRANLSNEAADGRGQPPRGVNRRLTPQEVLDHRRQQALIGLLAKALARWRIGAGG